jgi:cytochrome c biogenesis protein CcmG/thiol:disulfide interchange protein DsbE
MPARQKPSNNRPLIFGAVLIVVLALVAYFATRGEETSTGSNVAGDSGDTGGEGIEMVRPVTVDGPALPSFERDVQDAAIGQTAPQIRGSGFAGSSIDIEPGDQPQLIIFVAHWCPHCQREVPKIVQWLEDSGTPEGLDMTVVATATDPNRPNYPPSEWLDEEGLNLPAMADDEDGSAAEAMGLSGYPYFVLLDRNHKVLARDTGELTTEQLDALVEMAEGDS